jgi:hypothetical protein
LPSPQPPEPTPKPWGWPEEDLMSLANKLRAEAGMIAENVKVEGLGLAADLLQAEQIVSELKAKLENCNAIQSRLLTYKPEAGRDPDCPYCWLLNGQHSPIKPLEEPGKADRYSCNVCGFEFVDPTP